MASVKVRNLEIGDGVTKICVPIVGKTEEEIINSARKITEIQADLVEWRVDWFEEIFDIEKVQNVLSELREILEDCPILFTCRTSEEGGQISMTKEQYVILNQYVIDSECADLVDVEIFEYPDAVNELIALAHNKGVKVIGSNHDFHTTPSREEIIRRLMCMQEVGIDIAKIAVMPQDVKDVLILLSATEEMTRLHTDTPVITMSMGAKGVLSRVTGDIFGSAVTFASVGNTSAPGQLDVEELRSVMKRLR